jgi:hypothetical protein
MSEPKSNWLEAISMRNNENITRYSNGDSFEGDFDDDGLPAYGKMIFANGNVYYGPINTSWQIQRENGLSEDDELEEYEDEYSYIDDYENYGEMFYPDGRSFYGAFCFPSKSQWISVADKRSD